MLNELGKQIHQDCIDKGFYDTPRELGTLLMLIVSEVAEANEAARINKFADPQLVLEMNPENCGITRDFLDLVKDTFEDEIADTIIRLLDLCAYMNIDIEKHISLKLAYNKTRPYKHNKLF